MGRARAKIPNSQNDLNWDGAMSYWRGTHAPISKLRSSRDGQIESANARSASPADGSWGNQIVPFDHASPQNY